MIRPARALLAATSVCLTLVAASVAGAAPRVTIPHQRYRLPNGLTVVLAEDHRAARVAVSVWYRVGPVDEAAGRSGFAHLFEHLMFAGSAHVGEGRHTALLEAAGATDANAITEFDHTRYFETVPSSELALALWLESDRMGFLRVTPARLESERATVRNERRQTDESTPYGRSDDALIRALYPAGHPYHGHVIGSHEDIDAATLDEVRAFHCANYGPARATLVLVGDFREADARRLVDRYFATLPPRPCGAAPDDKAAAATKFSTPSPRASLAEPVAARRIVVEEPVALARVAIGFVTPPAFASGEAEVDLATRILGEGRASRLYRKLVRQAELASAVSCQHEALALGSYDVCEATARLGVPVEKLEAALREGIAELREHGPTEAEVQRARSGLEASVVAQLDAIGGVGGKADVLGYYDVYLDDPGYLAEDLARYQRTTSESLREAVRIQFDERHAITVVTNPRRAAKEKKTPGETSSSENGSRKISPPKGSSENRPTIAAPQKTVEAFRFERPRSGQASRLKLPPVSEIRLDNGLRVWLLERHDLPYVVARAIFPAGDEAQPPGRDGLAALTAELVQSGSRGADGTLHDADAIAESLAELGAELETGTTREVAYLQLSTLKATLTAAFGRFAELLLRPEFSASELMRARGQQLADLAHASRDPALAIADVMPAVVYGARHPYGTLHLGTPESVAALTLDDVVAFHRARYRLDGATLILVGDVDSKDARRLVAASGLDQVIEQDASATTARVLAIPPPAPEVAPGTVVRIDTGLGDAASVDVAPGEETEAEIGFAIASVGRRDPAFLPLLLGVVCLGGSDTSRLFLRLREERGYTYGLGSHVEPLRGPSLVFAVGGVRPDATDAALAELRRELGRIVEEPPTRSEVALARSQLLHGVAAQLATMHDGAALLADWAVHGYAPTELPSLIGQLGEISPGAVARALRAHLRVSEARFFIAAGSPFASPASSLPALPVVVDGQGRRRRSEPPAPSPPPAPP